MFRRKIGRSLTRIHADSPYEQRDCIKRIGFELDIQVCKQNEPANVSSAPVLMYRYMGHDKRQKSCKACEPEFGDEAGVHAHGEGVRGWIGKAVDFGIWHAAMCVIPASGSGHIRYVPRWRCCLRPIRTGDDPGRVSTTTWVRAYGRFLRSLSRRPLIVLWWPESLAADSERVRLGRLRR